VNRRTSKPYSGSGNNSPLFFASHQCVVHDSKPHPPTARN